MLEFNLDVLAERIYTEYANLQYDPINVNYNSDYYEKRFITIEVTSNFSIHVNADGSIDLHIPLALNLHSPTLSADINVTHRTVTTIPIAQFETEEECMVVIRCICRKHKRIAIEHRTYKYQTGGSNANHN